MNRYIYNFFQFLVLFLLCTFAYHADALVLYTENTPGVVQKGDTVIVKVFVDTEGKEINALEGVVRVSGGVEIKSTNTGGSIFSLWPVYPSIQGKEISFTGGTPSSAFGNRLHVFSFAVTALKMGAVIFDTSEVSAFLADGNGTKITSSSKKQTSFPILAKTKETRDDLKNLGAEDDVSPQKFSVEYGRDPSLYNGKVFISFYTTDATSGVVGYDVTEEGNTTRVVGNTYVLQNQNLVGSIKVTAVDLAGNIRTEEITFGAGHSVLYQSIRITGLIILILISIFFGYRFYKKKE